jgi:hypothetical protein
MKKRWFLFISLIALINNDSFSQKPINEKPHWYIPDYANIQYAGNIGFFSSGIGYYIIPKYRVYADIIYGYTPSDKSSIDIHNIVLRIGYKPFNIPISKDIDLRPIFINIAVSKLINSNSTWEKLPNYFPDGYYPQNAFRFHFDFGISAKYNFKNKLGLEFYFLSTTNDLYLNYNKHYYRNGKIHFNDIFSAALGGNVIFYEKRYLLNPS